MASQISKAPQSFSIFPKAAITVPADYLTFMRVCGYQRIGLTRYLPIYCIVLDCKIETQLSCDVRVRDACVRIHLTAMASVKIISII